MLVRNRATGFADRMDKPVRILSAVVLALVILGTIIAEREDIAGYVSDVGLPALLFCIASLTIGFLVPRLLGVVRGQAIASAFEIGVHNGTLAIAVAIGVLHSPELAVPAAVYSVIMFPAAAVFGWVITRAPQRRDAEEIPARL
jgi:BASS family bile acid:Na+ symporter